VGWKRGNQSLDVRVGSPRYKPDRGRALGYLNVSATYDPKGRQVFVNVLNRSEMTGIRARIENQSCIRPVL
jgi:alpha-L-arabinofuranosidase